MQSSSRNQSMNDLLNLLKTYEEREKAFQKQWRSENSGWSQGSFDGETQDDWAGSSQVSAEMLHGLRYFPSWDGWNGHFLEWVNDFQ